MQNFAVFGVEMRKDVGYGYASKAPILVFQCFNVGLVDGFDDEGSEFGAHLRNEGNFVQSCLKLSIIFGNLHWGGKQLMHWQWSRVRQFGPRDACAGCVPGIVHDKAKVAVGSAAVIGQNDACICGDFSFEPYDGGVFWLSFDAREWAMKKGQGACKGCHCWHW